MLAAAIDQSVSTSLVALDSILWAVVVGGFHWMACYHLLSEEVNVTMLLLLLLPLFFIWDEPFIFAVVTVVTSIQFVGSRLVFSLRVPLSDTLL